ncbi:threonine ammonia-lyase [Sphingomicrobium lutaoense]|uniref:Threonine dehydratase n=1 Tax=Sphingomicrobium lutaoense TaxID=515949 RepID=A0A839YXJ3_9SPHN|nr:threonine/serine dehydratase [Sphingomicrobium lutaoense]MBB3763756.1 threonine dehydratase [Sphingomicrobium lutaoense]
MTVTIKEVEEAAHRIADAVRRTPLTCVMIGAARVAIKWENRQEGGSFKLRGASNRLLALPPEKREAGVVAFSSGNHARGVAIAARRLGMKATIVMPEDAPRVKLDATRAEGAEVILYDRMNESREEIAERIAAERGAVLVPSFDDPYIMAGQGSVGLEIRDQLAEMGLADPGQIFVPCGGGGLSGGIALACPDATIVCVEPQGWNDMARSLEAGEPRSVPVDPPPTLCDAIQTFRPARLTVETLVAAGAQSAEVSEEEVKTAIRHAWIQWGETVEPGGAAGLAAALSGRHGLRDGDVIVVSGGNVDPGLHRDITA